MMKKLPPDKFYTPKRIKILLENYLALKLGRLTDKVGEIVGKSDWPPYVGHGNRLGSEVREIKADIDSATNSLPAIGRRVIFLYYIEGYSDFEVAQKTRHSEWRIKRIRRISVAEMAKFLGWRG